MTTSEIWSSEDIWWSDRAGRKNEVSMEEVSQPIMQSMVEVIQFLTEPKLRKHPKVKSRMELGMEQMINQMNQLSLHLL